MHKLLTIVLAGLLAGTATVSFAKKPTPVESHSGGMSAGHMSDKGMANTNGPVSTNQVRGLDRSMDRRSDRGLEHSNAFEAHQRTDGHTRRTGNRNR